MKYSGVISVEKCCQLLKKPIFAKNSDYCFSPFHIFFLYFRMKMLLIQLRLFFNNSVLKNKNVIEISGMIIGENISLLVLRKYERKCNLCPQKWVIDHYARIIV